MNHPTVVLSAGAKACEIARQVEHILLPVVKTRSVFYRFNYMDPKANPLPVTETTQQIQNDLIGVSQATNWINIGVNVPDYFRSNWVLFYCPQCDSHQEDWQSLADILMAVAQSPQNPSITVIIARDLSGDEEEKTTAYQKFKDCILFFHAALDGLPNNSIPLLIINAERHNHTAIQDEQELAILAGNILLSAMQPEYLSRLHSMIEDHDRVCSAASSVLLLDAEEIQRQCIFLSVQEFLARKIQPELETELTIKTRSAHEIQRLPGFSVWLQSIFPQLSNQVSLSVLIQNMDCSVSAQIKDFIIPELDFEDLPGSTWPEQVYRSLESLKTGYHPLVHEAAQHLVLEQTTRIKLQLSEIINALLLDPSLYPGGIKNSIGVLKEIKASTKKYSEDQIRLLSNTEGKLEKLQAETNEVAAEIQEYLQKAPKPPALFKKIPWPNVRFWLSHIYVIWHYKKSFALLQLAMQKMVRLTHQLAGEQILKIVLSEASGFQKEFSALLETGIAEYQSFQEKINSLSIDQDVPLFTAEERHPLYRPSLSEHGLVGWASKKWVAPIDTWQNDLLIYLSEIGWRIVTTQEMFEWIQGQASTAYSPILKLTIEDIFSHWQTTETGKVDTQRYLSVAENSLEPLVSFSGDMNTVPTSIKLAYIANPEWRFCQPILDGYSPVPSNSTQVVIFSQIVANVNIQQMGWLFQKEIIHRKPVITRPLPDQGKNMIQKTFRWSYTPKGKKEAVEQEIQVEIDLSRYEEYHQKERSIREYHKYSEAEMPEVHSLALAFQTLHAKHRWSTYNQAANILTFVQTCFPYSDDKKTTGKDDWPRYPIETIVDETGDCEDVAILCAAILSRMGFGTVLVEYPHHLAFGVQADPSIKGDYLIEEGTGRKFYYGEATNQNWLLGMIPENYKGITPTAWYPIQILVSETGEN